MKTTLSLALAATAIAATSGAFATAANAGGRGHFGFHFQQFQQSYLHRAEPCDDDDYAYLRRKKAAAAAAASKQAQKAEKPVTVAVAKYADGQGRQFDLTSKVWFDGTNQCWMGDKPFLFKNGAWSYGDSRWSESNGSWRITSGAAPEQVSCDGIKAFEGKIKTAEAKPLAPKKIETAEVKTETVEKPAKVVTTTTAAKATECKKYFPSVGEMVSVPCGD